MPSNADVNIASGRSAHQSMANESRKPVISTAEMVMKICLIVSVVLGILIVVLALVGNRNVLDVGGSALTIVALQWFFYMWVRARRRSQQGRS